MICDKDVIDYLKQENFIFQYITNGEPKQTSITTFCSLNALKNNGITWVKKAREVKSETFESVHHCLVITAETLPFQICGIRYLVTENPKAVFFSILNHFWPQKGHNGIAQTAIVESKMIAADVSIGHFCYIGKDVTIGAGTVIEHNVTISNRVVIGERCIIHSGVVIGTDGFGFFSNEEGIPQKVPHYGGVTLGDCVEIGANTCIDRGTIDDTIIENNVKIDNLCHIAHNVKIGMGSSVIAQCLVGGSAQLGARSYLAPGAIVKNQLKIGQNALVGMGAVVLHDVPNDTVVAGVPAKELRRTREGDK